MGVDELGSRRSPPAAVRFGQFRLDPVRAEFTRSGQPVALRPKIYALLNLFAGSPGRVLGKEELLAALWPNAVVAEGSLSQCVTELRAALGESGDSLIKTVPRQGYRFDAEVLPDPVPLAVADQDKPSIAVLPFDNIGGDPEQEYFADGMVEEITTALSRMRSLFVVARISSLAYKGKAADVKQIGRELGVRYLLEGSVRKVGNRLRITGQLVDATTGAHIWADRFDGGLEDVFALQDRVTESVVGAVLPKLESAEIERAKRKPTANLHAYDYYLRGLAVYRQFSRQGRMDEPLQLFMRAIELDPEFAFAHAMAACCYAVRKTTGCMTDPEKDLPEAARLAARAVELGAEDPFTLGACGWVIAYVVGDLDAGCALVDRALALNPNLSNCWQWGGTIKVWLGEPDEAIARFERAMRLGPLNPYLWISQLGTAQAHLMAGRYDEASAWAEKALQRASDHPTVLRIHAASSVLAGRLEQARRSVTRLLERDPTLRVSAVTEIMGPHRRAEYVAKYENALRMAGLPE
jgi:TolB-like protein/tetratricopeptide (TPR) repeat protein